MGLTVNAGLRMPEKRALFPGADYPEDVADGYAGRYQPEEGAEVGIECQADSQAEIEDHYGEYEEQDVSDYFQHDCPMSLWILRCAQNDRKEALGA